ncbi:MAG: PH domain-containing protein [Anaerolineae bacterium]|jgi:membrane protein YdbS with pleckstrin-like domain
MQSLKPSPKYLTKMYVSITIVAVLILLSAALLSFLITLDSDPDADDAARIIFIVTLVCVVLCWLPALFLARAYYRSLRYEIQDDEVIVHVGIWTQSVKHVPYRTVTNITVKRDIFDRWFFDLGSLNIQTAGMSGATGAEESLVGLPNFQEAYDTVAAQLQRFRGSMGPTAAEVEVEPDALNAILAEVRTIRQTLEKRA